MCRALAVFVIGGLERVSLEPNIFGATLPLAIL